MKGQALVEMALVTPILLFILLGGLALGIMLLERMELTHAAQEGAVAGAMNPGDSCGRALAVAKQIHAAHEASCAVQGQYIEVSLSRDLPLIVPFFANSVSISVTERAVLR